MPPRLIRRRPLADRVQAYLNPLDLLLWLSEELASSEWEAWQQSWAVPVGVALNLVFLISRANSGGTRRNGGDDVFGDSSHMGGLNWLAAFVVHLLSLLSFLNAAYTFYRRRHYRLFEASVDVPPSAPSAHRVRVDSSPVSSSPLRFLSSMLAATTAESRAHPDATRDVWEVAVWDPLPICLKLFCLFSPGHVLVYWLFLPTAPHETRPSITVFTTMILASLLSVQLMALRSSFSQQSKDTSVIHKEVLNEYDTKYVHPRTQPVMRDVGTQYCGDAIDDMAYPGEDIESVDAYTPTTVINRGFHTRPNPNYIKHVDPQGYSRTETPLRKISASPGPSLHTPAHLRDTSSPIRPRTAIRQPQLKPNDGIVGGDGGSLGVYSHAQSPLRKSASTHFVGRPGERARSSTAFKRAGSPLKRTSMAADSHPLAVDSPWLQSQRPSASRESGRF